VASIEGEEVDFRRCGGKGTASILSYLFLGENRSASKEFGDA